MRSSFNSLARAFFAGEELSMLLQAYQLSLLNGAASELDFMRRDGESFNPRPVRVLHILLNSALLTTGECQKIELATAALLYETGNLDGNFLENFLKSCTEPQLCQRAVRLALAVPKSPTEAVDLSPEQLSILGSSWLDRARHAHRSLKWQDREFKGWFLEQSALLITLLHNHPSQLKLLLKAWVKRFNVN